MEHLPQQVLWIILQKLPAVTLTTVARHVCRSWRDLIQQPSFSRTRSLSPSSHGILLQIPGRHANYIYEMIPNGIRHPGIGDDDLDRYYNKYYLDGYFYCVFITIQNPRLHVLWDGFFDTGHLEVVHSCDGLLLLSDKSRRPAVICNPVLHRCVSLPVDPVKKTPTQSSEPLFDYGWTGLGFDPIDEVYKVFNFVKTGSSSRCRARVCTLRGDNAEEWEWRPPSGGEYEWELSYNCRSSSSVALVQGKLHWMSNDGRSLVVVDVRSEVVSLLPLPMLRDRCRCLGIVGVTAEGGLLDVCVYQLGEDTRAETVEIWVMREYGLPESWTKEKVTSRECVGSSLWLRSSSWLLHLPRSNDRDWLFCFTRVVPYVPTLVWPKVRPSSVSHVTASRK